MLFVIKQFLKQFYIVRMFLLWRRKIKEMHTELRQSTLEVKKEIYCIKDAEPKLSKNEMLVSQLCTQSQFNNFFAQIAAEIKEPLVMRRKLWEFVYIIQALKERGMLKAGNKAVGYGVGQEPLPALFAKYGVEVLATDYSLEQAKTAGWVSTDQHLSSKELLNSRNIAPMELFDELVNVREVDMNNIPEDITGYDFTWSSCALEHLGSIEQGLAFIENSLKALKPGGVAVHTTEYNLSSNADTLDHGGTVIFRRSDIEELVKRLIEKGHEIYMNYNPGDGELDKYVDLPPYKPDPHLKLLIDKYVTTSIGFIIRKSYKI